MAKSKPAPASRLLGWFPEILRLGSHRIRGQVRLLGLAALVGIVAGLGGITFYIATRVVEHYALGVWAGYYAQPHPGGEPSFPWLTVVPHPLHPWLLLLIPALGSIASGVLVFTLAPEAEGHGTDAVIAAYHYQQGQIRPRVPLVKIVASAVTLGTGGSGGREGPIAQIGAGFGSLLANLLRLRPAERRILTAAGIGAIFRAPLAGTMFAAEVFIVPLPRIRARGHHSGGDRLRGLLFYLRRVHGLGAALYHPQSGVQRSLGTGSVPAPGPGHGPAGVPLHAFVLRLPAALPAFAPAPAFTARPRRLFDGAGGSVIVLSAGPAGEGARRTILRVLRHSERDDARRQCQCPAAADHRPGQDSHDESDHRQRRLGRRVRTLHGDRRLWRRRAGNRAAQPLAGTDPEPPRT